MNLASVQAWAARRSIRFWIFGAVVALVLLVVALPRATSSSSGSPSGRTTAAQLRSVPTSSLSPAATSAASAQAAAASRAAAASSAGSAAAQASRSAAAAASSAAAACEPGYDPCIPPGPDVDCASGKGNGPRYVQGPIDVSGDDPYDLDRDGDGIGCEDG